MRQSKEEKTKAVLEFLRGHGLFVNDKGNGHLIVDKVNLWATSEKWYDPMTNAQGIGVNSFLEYVTDRKE